MRLLDIMLVMIGRSQECIKGDFMTETPPICDIVHTCCRDVIHRNDCGCAGLRRRTRANFQRVERYFEAPTTNRVFDWSRRWSVFRMSSPIASMRVMLCGLNCASYGLRVGPPDTSSTASNL